MRVNLFRIPNDIGSGGGRPYYEGETMMKAIIYLLVLIFSGHLFAYAAGPSGSHGGARGGYRGAGTSYRGTGTGGGYHDSSGNYRGSGSGYHGSPSYRGGYKGGYHNESNYHGHNYHRGHGNSYSFWIGGWAPGWWGPYPYPSYYPYYYPYYQYPYYAPGTVVAEEPAVSDPSQDQDSYWYYCQNPKGYYPYIKTCPGGWMKVVPQSVPPNQ